MRFNFSYQDRELGRTASFADDRDILDSMITRGRGEIRRICSLKISSSAGTPTKSKEFRSLSDKGFSAHVSELSPRAVGRGPFSPRTAEGRQSNLGKSG